jgi:hypothetical protein
MESSDASRHESGTHVLSVEDREALRAAKRSLEDPGLAAKLANLLGAPLEGLIKNLPRTWSSVITRATAKALHLALDTALITVATQRSRPSRDRLHTLMVAGTGAVGGAFGLAALAVELPASTVVMLRSILDIARSEGEDLATVDARLACIEVFALGGRTSRDDADESAYFAARAALASAVTEAARYLGAKRVAQRGAPVLVRLISEVASRFGATVTQKVAAQAVPVVGGLGGATLNVLFMGHFQSMARGHFVVRRLERKYGADVIRGEYDRLAV